MYNYSLQSFQWFSLACRCGKTCSLRPGKKGFLTTAKWDPERFQSAASMSVLVILSYPWQETISFLNINQKWSQATDFTSRSKFGAVQIWPDILGLGPGLTLPTKQFDISSYGKLSSPVQSHPQGPAPCCPKLPSWSGFSKSTRLLCQLRGRTCSFRDAALAFFFLPLPKRSRVVLSAVRCSPRGKDLQGGKTHTVCCMLATSPGQCLPQC